MVTRCNILNVKAKTIYSWVGKGTIPFYRIQKVLRFKKADIDCWLAEKRSAVRDLKRLRVNAIADELGI